MLKIFFEWKLIPKSLAERVSLYWQQMLTEREKQINNILQNFYFSTKEFGLWKQIYIHIECTKTNGFLRGKAQNIYAKNMEYKGI